MTWSISRSGKVEEVKALIEAETFDSISDEGEKKEAFAFKDAVLAVVTNTTTTNVSVSAFGSKGGSVSCSISRSNE